MDYLKHNKVLLRHEKNKDKQIKKDNIELLMNFISYYVLKIDNRFSSNDLLILAKLSVAFFFEYNCRKMVHMIQQLFSDCIEKAFHESTKFDFISFYYELNSIYTDVELGKVIANVFLPIRNDTMKKLYKFFSFKLYQSLLGIAIEKVFPDLDDW